jgi:hypothetical protein
MSKTFIIHGSYGNPEENWFPWLKDRLESAGQAVYVPKFPTPENQSLESWRETFKDYEKYLDDNSIFVGHSLGPAFILDVIERSEIRIKAAFFVAGFIQDLGNKDFDGVNRTFIHRDFDWSKIKQNCRKFEVFCSDDDPYVPLEIAEDLARKLGVEAEIISGAGHFNKEAGYDKFDLLLEKIKKEADS